MKLNNVPRGTYQRKKLFGLFIQSKINNLYEKSSNLLALIVQYGFHGESGSI